MSAIASWEGFSTTDLTRSRARRHLQVVPEVQPRPVTRSDRLRLTRAGRLALTVLITLLLSGVALAVMTPRAVSSPQRVVTVQAGQTLSELAATLMPEVTPAEGVARIQIANRLNSAHVLAGQQLVIPGVR
ncbi:MAG TPA: LysM peptidoglycan-binding domain-containing protein [Dermatophilaceae bacterium]|nr:LysM peptidoglycan-binding domain-containing protein [Dermatophilaceae bacterium]